LASVKRVECVEEFFLRPRLVVEELDVVDQQHVERAVIALEGVETLLLIGAHHVGVVVLGVHVADDRIRVVPHHFVAQGVHQVRLAQTHVGRRR
jgi:hypothetical protein